MVTSAEVLKENQQNYEALYSNNGANLQYPADWVIRFHNMFLKDKLPGGRVLDYGCGGGNNSIFFLQKGYEVHGVDVAPSAMGLVEKNLAAKHLPAGLIQNFGLITPDQVTLDYPDSHFDFILSNQVLYYLPTADHLKSVCGELRRILKPGGTVFFTMMGLKNYYISRHTKQILSENLYDVRIETPGHRLEGVHEMVYVIRDEDHLKQVFSDFACLSVGYFDQSMFDMLSNFHWIFIGEKP